ncbi:MAG: FAD-binding oxidoreductase [Ignavibacteria bacterium]|nr:FAD-binding oxidoreductase [Ignavibacteria bacterium]
MKNFPSNTTDYLIIGGGLAGCILAWTLRQRGLQCQLMDTPLLSNASRISAGIINPISGKRFSPLWEPDVTTSVARQTYRELEVHFGQSFLREIPALRLFTDADERDIWLTKRAETLRFAEILTPSEIAPRFVQDCGGIRYMAWHVDVEAVVLRLRAWLRDEGCLVEEEFDDTCLSFTGTEAVYKAKGQHIRARRIIMCNGWRTLRSELWKELPLTPAKGELLIVRADAPPVQELIVKSVFLLPLENHALEGSIMRIGASYSWEHLDETPTPETAQILIRKAQEILPVPMTILRHDAGVRPAAQDSKPIVGVHPHETLFAIMNGFGSKGAAYTPFCAAALIDFLEEGKPMAEWCSLARWKAWR